MHLWDQHSAPAGQFPAQNPAAEAQQQWQPADQPVQVPAHSPGCSLGPGYQPPSTLAPAHKVLQDNSHAAVEAAGQTNQQQQSLGDNTLGGQAGASPYDGCQAGFPAGHSGFSPRPDTAPQQGVGSQHQQGMGSQHQQGLGSSSFGLMGPPASRAIPCPTAKLAALSSPSAAATVLQAAGEGLGGQSLSMDTSMLDLPEPDAMSWRPGGWVGWGGGGHICYSTL